MFCTQVACLRFLGCQYWLTLACGYVRSDLGYVQADLGYFQADLGYVRSDLGYVQSNLGYVHSNLAYVQSNLGYVQSNRVDSSQRLAGPELEGLCGEQIATSRVSRCMYSFPIASSSGESFGVAKDFPLWKGEKVFCLAYNLTMTAVLSDCAACASL